MLKKILNYLKNIRDEFFGQIGCDPFEDSDYDKLENKQND